MTVYTGFSVNSRRRANSAAPTMEEKSVSRRALRCKRRTLQEVSNLTIEALDPAQPSAEEAKPVEPQSACSPLYLGSISSTSSLSSRTKSLQSVQQYQEESFSCKNPTPRAQRIAASSSPTAAAAAADLTEVYQLAKTFCNEFERLQQPNSSLGDSVDEFIVSPRRKYSDSSITSPSLRPANGLVPHPPTPRNRSDTPNEIRARWFRQANTVTRPPSSSSSVTSSPSPSPRRRIMFTADQSRQFELL